MSPNRLKQIPSGIYGRGIVLQGVSWDTYERLVNGAGDRRAFVTFDRGVMEIEMSPSRKRESGVELLAALVYAIRLLKGIPIESGGSTTHKRSDLQRGLEPDACFGIENEASMRGVADLDLTHNPPPDLVIEVDVTSSSLDRIDLYRQLGVPEIWRVSMSGLDFLVLSDADGYVNAELSRSFPFVARDIVEQALAQSDQDGETAALESLLVKLGLK